MVQNTFIYIQKTTFVVTFLVTQLSAHTKYFKSVIFGSL